MPALADLPPLARRLQLGQSGRWAHLVTAIAMPQAAVANITGTLASPA